MKPFRFCPACGAGLAASDDGGGRCAHCGRSWYRNPAPTVGCAIVDGGRALVTVRARPPEQGRIDVPGGFLEPGEHPLDGLRREVAEEICVDVEVSEADFVHAAPHRYGDEGDWVLALGFAARYAGGEIRCRDDVADARWVAAADLDDLDFAWPHDRELVRRALDGRP